MATVYFNTINPFDAKFDKKIPYYYSGGNQQYYHKVTITNSITNTTVYSETRQTLQLNFTIPANKLTNGGKYSVQISVYDIDMKLQGTSINMNFICLTTPIFQISNLKDGQIIRTSNYNFELMYKQAEGELLQSYKMSLYDNNKTLLYTSGNKYNIDNMFVNISSLEDNIEYYVQAEGITVNGLVVNTGYIKLIADYLSPSSFYVVSLENVENKGAILIRSNIVSIEGHSKKDVIYVDGSYADLTNDNEVSFSEGFETYEDFTIIGSGYNFQRNKIIFSMKDTKDRIVNVEYRIGNYEETNNRDMAYLQLSIPTNFSTYIIKSNYIELPNQRDILSYCIRREGSYFEVKLLNAALLDNGGEL